MPAGRGNATSLAALATAAALLAAGSSRALALPLPTTTLTVPLPTITVTVTTATLTLPTTTLTLPTTTLTLRVTTTSVTLPLPTTTVTFPLPTTTSNTIVGATTTTVSTRPPTTSAGPTPCTPQTCDDGNPCTEDHCDVLVGCQHAPLTGPACDDGDPCTGGDHCIAGLCSGPRIGCAATPRCPETCRDDGFSCTDEVCTAAGCLHVPVDARCVSPGRCTAAVCAPGSAGADEAGCVPGVVRGDGQACAEDADPCTVDVCRGGECLHERPADTMGCGRLQGVFRETLALGDLTGDLLGQVAAAASASADALVASLTGIQDDLAAAARALAGERADFVPATARPRAASDTPATLRARIAFTHVLRTPRQVSAFLQDVASAQAAGDLNGSTGRKLRRDGRRLLVGTKQLRAELKQLATAKVRTRGRRQGRSAAARGD
jgi:hypothetical protein